MEKTLETNGEEITAGQVAQHQAAIIVLRLSYRQAEKLFEVTRRTIWNHVKAKKGSNVRTWWRRTNDEKKAAILAVIRRAYDRGIEINIGKIVNCLMKSLYGNEK
ncbi:MAG: hypothetical protein ONB11_12070 [candidate division KSB1 bacterium]|nr:hypothetical protein [candidate division KSB1 bacterium]